MTGSVSAGEKIMAAAARNITKVSLELGGKAPVIVMDDCDLDKTVEWVWQSRIVNGGQACNCAERVYVQEGIAEEFTKKIIRRIKATKFGNPADDPKKQLDMGPMINKAQVEHIDELVKGAVKEGGKIACGGKPARIGGKGFYYEPTVITDCTHDMTIFHEEIFGPVLPITTFKTLDEAIEKANDCEYGLTSSIYTTNTDTMLKALNRIKFGETYVNREHFEAFQGFHQGVRKSGIGGDDGEHCLDEFLSSHICYVDYDLQ